jgi:hypothetical protein
MIALFWPSRSFALAQVLPPKVTITTKGFIDNILPDIVAAKGASRPDRRLVRQMDNDSPDYAKPTSRKLEEL